MRSFSNHNLQLLSGLFLTCFYPIKPYNLLVLSHIRKYCLSLASLNVKTEMNYIIREKIVKLAPNWPRVQCQYLIFETGILQIKLN